MMDCVKLVVVGDEEVNKTRLLISYVHCSLPGEEPPMLLNNIVTMFIRGEQHTILLWDTTGQEQYDRVRLLGYPQTDVLLVCFSVVSPSSYKNVREKWVPEITQHCPNVPFLLVGTMTDLRDDHSVLKELAQFKERPLRPEDGEELARELGAVKYMECSAKTKEGVKEVFEEAVSALFEEDDEPKKTKKKCVLQ